MMTKEVQEQASSKNLTALHYPTQVEQDNEHFLQQFAQHRVPPLPPLQREPARQVSIQLVVAWNNLWPKVGPSVYLGEL